MPELNAPGQGGVTTPAGTVLKPKLTPRPAAPAPVAAPATAAPAPVAAAPAAAAPTIKRAGGPPTARKKVGPGAIAAAAAAKAAGAAPKTAQATKAARKAAPVSDPDGDMDIIGLTPVKPKCWWAAMFLILTLILTIGSLLVLLANLQGKDGLRAQLASVITPVAGIAVVPEAIVDTEAKVKEVTEAAAAGCKSGTYAAADLATVL